MPFTIMQISDVSFQLFSSGAKGVSLQHGTKQKLNRNDSLLLAHFDTAPFCAQSDISAQITARSILLYTVLIGLTW